MELPPKFRRSIFLDLRQDWEEEIFLESKKNDSFQHCMNVVHDNGFSDRSQEGYFEWVQFVRDLLDLL